MSKILEILYRHQDEKYGDFVAKLVPTVPREAFIGIRAPEYKKIVKEVHDEAENEIAEFMNNLPHKFQEENNLHIMLISEMRDYDKCVAALEFFLPYINSWTVSDSLRPKIFEKNHEKLIQKITIWIKDDAPYTKRVALLFLMKFFLGKDFSTEYLDWAAQIRSDHYYVNMMIAWYFAEALVKQWDAAIEYFTTPRLDTWTHNKAIQKARESFRISPEQKEYLKSLKITK